MLSEEQIKEMIKIMDKKIERGYQNYCMYAVRATLKHILEEDIGSDILLMQAAIEEITKK